MNRHRLVEGGGLAHPSGGRGQALPQCVGQGWGKGLNLGGGLPRIQVPESSQGKPGVPAAASLDPPDGLAAGGDQAGGCR
jgi:hypothetical protein